MQKYITNILGKRENSSVLWECNEWIVQWTSEYVL